MTDIGTAGIKGISSAYGINDNGQVVGTDGAISDFLYASGTSTHIPGFLGIGGNTAYGMNSNGQVVGQAYSGYAWDAFLYSGGVLTNLGAFGGLFSEAFSINDSGQIVGVAKDSSSQQWAFLYSNGTMKNIGGLVAGRGSTARCINNSSHVVGEGGA